MIEISPLVSLVLPFALPPSDIAPDLVKALQTPALATLITRSAARKRVAADLDLRTLPHESWLARALGLSSDGQPAFAAQAMRHYGLDPVDGVWFIVNPAHIEIARSHLLLHDVRGLRLPEAQSRALFDAALPYFTESGKTLLWGDATTWFLRADDWAGLSTASLDAATGLNMTDFMPLGAKAVEYRKLQNEIQMLWFSHPSNAEREQRGLPAINGFWPWGMARATAQPPRKLAARGAPSWLAALAGDQDASLDTLLASGQDAILVCAEPLAPALASDWSSWLASMQDVEQNVLMPALNALKDGRVRQLRLVLSHRLELIEYTVTRMSLRAFWRAPSLTKLLP